METKKKTLKGFCRINGIGGWFISLAIIVPFLLWGCEKDINIDLNEESQKLVVEATIENGQPPFVILSRSLNYFSTISPQTLSESFVRGAEVFVLKRDLDAQTPGVHDNGWQQRAGVFLFSRLVEPGDSVFGRAKDILFPADCQRWTGIYRHHHHSCNHQAHRLDVVEAGTATSRT
jgi:hypothetical protein